MSSQVLGDAPPGEVNDDTYDPRRGDREPVPVKSDSAEVEDPIDASKADTDEQLGMCGLPFFF